MPRTGLAQLGEGWPEPESTPLLQLRLGRQAAKPAYPLPFQGRGRESLIPRPSPPSASASLRHLPQRGRIWQGQGSFGRGERSVRATGRPFRIQAASDVTSKAEEGRASPFWCGLFALCSCALGIHIAFCQKSTQRSDTVNPLSFFELERLMPSATKQGLFRRQR